MPNPIDIDFVALVSARLSEPLPGATAHSRFSPRPPRRDPFLRDVPSDARQAAALILLYPCIPETSGRRLQASDYSLPLTVRRADLPDHAGQISLPGGRIDVGETAEAAALREASEEIGVDPSLVHILGSLTPLYVQVSRFLIMPFVGVATARPHFRLDEREVAELIEAPIPQLQDPTNLQWGHRTREGYLIDFPYFDLDGHKVWGATAMMLGELLLLLNDDFGPPAQPLR